MKTNQAELDLLVLTAQNGNHRAFGLLVELHHKPLVGFAYKLSNDNELANDVVQESWIKAAKNIRKLNDPRAFKSWIYRLVRWKLLDMLRRKSRESIQLEELNEDSTSSILDGDSSEDETLSIAIKRLPDLEKQIIHLFYLDEMKIAEISTILEIPAGTVKSRLNRARQMLKQKYQQLEN